MTNDRLRIPQDPEYFQALGLAAVAFSRLEWAAVWCCERLEPGYTLTLEKDPARGIKRGKTAGDIGEDLEALFSRIADPSLRSRFVSLAVEFRALVHERNGLVHGKPGTTDRDEQRLFRHGNPWTLDAVNEFSDRCLRAELPLNALLREELKEGHGVALEPKPIPTQKRGLMYQTHQAPPSR